jgi:hypothetical protein
MPKITNKYNLPEAFVRAVFNDPYDKGDSDFSVTELLKPARARALERQFEDLIEEDASDRVFSLLGQSVHHILQRAAREGVDLVEKRFFADFDGVKLSGQIDLLSNINTPEASLSDWKVTRSYPFTVKGGKGQKPEWVHQLNMQLELLRKNGMDAKYLFIVGILRDWDAKCLDPKNKLKYMSGYPEAEVSVVSIPIWTREKTQEFILKRIQIHKEADQQLPLCTVEETWGGRRCKDYCRVSRFCTQYQQAQKTGLLEPQKEMPHEVSHTT